LIFDATRHFSGQRGRERLFSMVARERLDPAKDAERHAIDLLRSMRDSCASFDSGGDYQFRTLAGHLRTFCHDGSSGALLNAIREKGREFPSSIHRDLSQCHTAASDLFRVVSGPPSRILPRLDIRRDKMKPKKFKHWWREIVITDQANRSLSRGQLVIELANPDAVHFGLQVDEVYDELARHNGMGLFAREAGDWRDYGLAPIQASIRQIAHEFLLGMETWIAQRSSEWSYNPPSPPVEGFAILPGLKLGFSGSPP
jgi:hypothetical protein